MGIFQNNMQENSMQQQQQQQQFNKINQRESDATNFIQINDSTPKNINFSSSINSSSQNHIDLVDQEMSSPKTAPWNRTMSIEKSTLSPWNTTAISTTPMCQTPPQNRFPSDKMEIAHDFSKTSSNIWSTTTTATSTDRNINSPPWSTHHVTVNSNNQSPVRLFDKYLFEKEERERSERVARAPWNQQSDFNDEKLLLNNSPADSVNTIFQQSPSLQQQVSPTLSLHHSSPALSLSNQKGNGILDAPLSTGQGQQQNLQMVHSHTPPPPPPPSSGLPRSTPNVQGKYLIEDDEGRAVEETVLWTGVKLRKPDGRDLRGKKLQIVGPTFHQMQQRKQQKSTQRKNSPSAVRKHSPKTSSVGTPGSNSHLSGSNSTPGSSVQRVISSCSTLPR